MNPHLNVAKRWIKHHLLHPWLISAVPNDLGQVALTFDDGPNPVHTRDVLRVLEQHGAKATFFCVGANLRRFSQIAEEIRIAGHEIANHSMTHAEFSSLTRKAIADEFDQAFSIALADGQPMMTPSLIRPPKGVINFGVLSYCWNRKARVVYWNRDPEDFATHGVDDLVARFTLEPLAAGDIVLLHDKVPHGPQAVARILEQLDASGLTAVTVSTLLETRMARPS